jgi:hypothetical protein
MPRAPRVQRLLRPSCASDARAGARAPDRRASRGRRQVLGHGA